MTELKTYSYEIKNDAMSRRFCADVGMLMIYPTLAVAEQGNVCKSKLDINVFSSEQKREIREFAMSYTQRMLVCGNADGLWIISPSIFPSSGFCPAVRLHARPSDALRALRDIGGDSIVFSEQLELRASRMSPRIDALKSELSELLEELSACFCNIFRLDECASREECLETIAGQCAALSKFVGCPTDLKINDRGGSSCFKLDLSIFSAFLLVNLTFARNLSLLREAELTLTFNGESASVDVRFEADGSVCLSNACMQISKSATDKGMYIYFSHRDGYVNASLHPVRDERAYTELKQRFEMKLK